MRRKARTHTLQALYEWQISQNPIAEIESRLLNTQKLDRVDVPYLRTLLKGIVEKVSELDQEILPLLDRPFEQLNPIELSVLRMGTYELLYQPDVPYKVVINEALELEKKFGAEDGYKYVNGILDKLAKKLHPIKS